MGWANLNESRSTRGEGERQAKTHAEGGGAVGVRRLCSVVGVRPHIQPTVSLIGLRRVRWPEGGAMGGKKNRNEEGEGEGEVQTPSRKMGRMLTSCSHAGTQNRGEDGDYGCSRLRQQNGVRPLN